MERRQFGTSGREIAVIGQGSWNIDRADWELAIAAIRRGLELGMNHVDTAEMYGSGLVEEMVAQAIDGRRDEVFLVSKVVPDNASRTGTVRACEQSLQRLRTDRLDGYLLHWRGEYPLEETISAFEQLQKEGKILNWGVSNLDVPDLEQALAISGKPFLCNQVLYHLKERSIEHFVLPWCERHGVAVSGYSPFGHGDFPSPRSRGGKLLRQIADRHGATERQVALRFLVRRPSVFAIPKAANPGHAEENARAGDLQLSTEELALIDEAFPVGPPPSSLPVL